MPSHATTRSRAAVVACRALVLLALIVASGASTARAAEVGADQMCPVTPTERASAAHGVQVGDRTVYVCCSRCAAKLRANPQRYVPHLNVTAAADVADAPAGGGGKQSAAAASPGASSRFDWGPPLRRRLRRTIELADRHRAFVYVCLAVLVAHLIVARLLVARPSRRGPAGPADVKPRWPVRLVRPVGRPLVLLVLLQLALIVELLRTGYGGPPPSAAPAAHPLFVKDLLDYAVLQDAGRARQLAATYYRGNDERHADLEHGGRYRTCTFHLSLRDADGKPVKAGDDVRGRRLSVRVEIVRAPFTADHFFAQMDESVVVPHTLSPWLARVPELPSATFRTRVPGQHWTADCPVLVGPAVPDAMVEGVLLVHATPPDAVDGGDTTSAAQYAILYSLHVAGGRIGPSSTLWMASTYANNMPGAEGLTGWFSERPIPELTRPNTDDPTLLGSD